MRERERKENHGASTWGVGTLMVFSLFEKPIYEKVYLQMDLKNSSQPITCGLIEQFTCSNTHRIAQSL